MGGKRKSSEEPQRRPLLVLVGPDTPSRFRTAKHLIDRDNAVVLCEGPPGCPLVRGEDCAIVGAADAVVILPSEEHTHEIDVSLTMCVRRAARAVIVEPTTVRPDADAMRVGSADAVAIAVPALLGQAGGHGTVTHQEVHHES